MDGGPDLLARIERLERDTRLLKRACAILLAPLAAGVLVTELVLSAHMEAAKDARPDPVEAVPAQR